MPGDSLWYCIFSTCCSTLHLPEWYANSCAVASATQASLRRHRASSCSHTLGTLLVCRCKHQHSSKVVMTARTIDVAIKANEQCVLYALCCQVMLVRCLRTTYTHKYTDMPLLVHHTAVMHKKTRLSVHTSHLLQAPAVCYSCKANKYACVPARLDTIVVHACRASLNSRHDTAAGSISPDPRLTRCC
jgi:hypothetical protein